MIYIDKNSQYDKDETTYFARGRRGTPISLLASITARLLHI